ncbi:MAG: hypothetical protein CVV44_02100 [Spirochaetae bacterium HGW-Spirochaetae-1]|jgi:hypothetical protein|nr:MAG: hypothetical protein CVV44_02100 [Spirochaetae bacterium HGW-Spirochaetae-1]
MKKILVYIAVLLIPCTAFSETDEKYHSLSFGVNVYYYDYHEKLPEPAKSNEIGWLPGFLIDYNYRDNNLYIRAALDFTYAKTVYDGSYMDIATGDIFPYTGKTLNLLLNTEGMIGYIFKGPDTKSAIIPYGGFGYHLWVRALQGEGGYSEYYSWNYFQLGLLIEVSPVSPWTVGINAAFKMMFNGRIRVNLSDMSDGYNNPESDLGSKPGCRIALPVTYAFTDTWRVSFSPWYEYSAIGRGDIFEIYYNGSLDSYGYEPASRTHQYGLLIMSTWNF